MVYKFAGHIAVKRKVNRNALTIYRYGIYALVGVVHTAYAIEYPVLRLSAFSYRICLVRGKIQKLRQIIGHAPRIRH